MPNPYLDKYNKLLSEHTDERFTQKCLHPDPKSYGSVCMYEARRKLVHEYSFAIPNDEAIKKIASFGKILEVGAGTGYWAKLIAEAGAEVIAVDFAPVNNGVFENEWKFNTEHFTVVRGSGLEWVNEYTPEYTLMMCWPPMSSFAADCLATTKGDYAIYIGEGSGGCTADDSFFEMIGTRYWDEEESTKKATWKIEDIIDIPQWDGIHDDLYILRRL